MSAAVRTHRAGAVVLVGPLNCPGGPAGGTIARIPLGTAGTLVFLGPLALALLRRIALVTVASTAAVATQPPAG